MPRQRRPLQQTQVVPALQAADALPHYSYDRGQLILFAGMRGYGKTTAMRRYLASCEPRVLAVDAFDDFAPMRRVPSMEAGIERMTDLAPHRLRFTPELVRGDDGKISVDGTGLSSTAWGENFFGDCFERLRNTLLGLDEISLWSKRNVESTPNLEAVVNQGRRRGLRMVVACQRIQRCPAIILSECTHLVVFHTARPRDLDVLEEWISDGEAVEEARRLEVGECLVLEL